MVLGWGTSYTLVKPDETVPARAPTPRVFLGGSCKGRDWRLDFYNRFEKTEVTFITPKRDTFIDPELDPAGHAGQVAWERQALDACDVGVFWLGEGLANQASRVEIGYLLGAKKPVLLGAEKKFMGIEHLTGFSGLLVTNSPDGLMNRFASMLASFKDA